MPNYTWMNKETGEEHTNTMTIAERDSYEANNPHLQQVLRNFTMVDPVNIGVTKPPADFQKGIIGRMKEKVHGNNLKNSKFNVPREW